MADDPMKNRSIPPTAKAEVPPPVSVFHATDLEVSIVDIEGHGQQLDLCFSYGVATSHIIVPVAAAPALLNGVMDAMTIADANPDAVVQSRPHLWTPPSGLPPRG